MDFNDSNDITPASNTNSNSPPQRVGDTSTVASRISGRQQSSRPPEAIIIALGVVSGLLFLCLLILYKTWSGRRKQRVRREANKASKSELLPIAKPSPEPPQRKPQGPRIDPDDGPGGSRKEKSGEKRSKPERNGARNMKGRSFPGRGSPNIRPLRRDNLEPEGLPGRWPALDDSEAFYRSPEYLYAQMMMERMAAEEAAMDSSSSVEGYGPPWARRGPREQRRPW